MQFFTTIALLASATAVFATPWESSKPKPTGKSGGSSPSCNNN
jgi:hypothetical protein